MEITGSTQIYVRDPQIKISSDDTTFGFPLTKLVGSSSIVVTETGGGGNETLVWTLDTSFTDALYVLKAGDTMTGTLVMSGLNSVQFGTATETIAADVTQKIVHDSFFMHRFRIGGLNEMNVRAGVVQLVNAGVIGATGLAGFTGFTEKLRIKNGPVLLEPDTTGFIYTGMVLGGNDGTGVGSDISGGRFNTANVPYAGFSTFDDGSTMGLFIGGNNGVPSPTQIALFTAPSYSETVNTATLKVLINTAIKFNPNKLDVDTIIFGVGVTELLFADASANRIGINTNAPDARLHVVGKGHITGNLQIDSDLDHDGSKIGLFGVTTTVRAGATDDIKDALTLYGLLQGTSASPLNLDGGALTVGAGTFSGNLAITPTSAASIVLNPHGTSPGNTGELRFLELVTNGTNYVAFKAPDNLAGNRTFTWPIDIQDGKFLKVATSGALSWDTPSASITTIEVDATATDSITSTTYVDINSMTNTPASGNYLVFFSAHGEDDSLVLTMDYAIHVGGTIDLASHREILPNAIESRVLHTQAKVTVNGSQAISVKLKVDAGQFDVFERSMILIKV